MIATSCLARLAKAEHEIGPGDVLGSMNCAFLSVIIRARRNWHCRWRVAMRTGDTFWERCSCNELKRHCPMSSSCREGEPL